MKFCILPVEGMAFGYVVANKRLVASCLPRAERVLREEVRGEWPGAAEDPDLLPRFRRDVLDYFAGRVVRFTVAIDLAGQPPFYRAVYEACRKIPYGKTASYLDLARAVGSPKAARAVGQAMAHNPVPLVIPCHRVLRADGSIGGFSSPQGLTLKSRMLHIEQNGVRRRDVA